ncbi:glycosyltransferase [Sphingosinicella sp. BN140058]|uniref:glycosyltransferase n=1 Tax=Sphingosinicella sp. BN140058 TaxID=1892855 RepID=UPI0010107E2F|nr:glycosyltransferase [Sphingosinicella sp. BN140058]
MRILSVLTSFTSGGAEMLVCNLAKQFAGDGHSVTIVALADAAAVGNSPDTEREMMAEARRAGINARSLSLVRRGNLFSGALAVRRLMAELRPDVIHAHTARAIPMLWLARTKAPILLTHHNTRLSFPPAMFRFFDLSVREYVAITPECARIARAHARRPIRLIPNAASEAFRAAAPRTRPAERPMILSVGALTPQKDYPTLIRAASHLATAMAATGRTPRIRIAGGGALMAELQTLVASERAGSIVELLGPRSDVRALMTEADLYVNCSLYEGMPIAILEALSSALPIVATDVPGNRELIDNRSGILVPGSDPQALALAVQAALTDELGYRRLSQGALSAAAAFTIDGCARAHLQLYADALRGDQLSRRAA